MRNSKPPTLGLMISHIFNSYSNLLLKGVQDEVARQVRLDSRSCRLTVFKGNVLNTPYNNMGRENIVYRSISPGSVDALLIPANIFTTHMPASELLPIVQGYRVPVVSMGLALDGYPAVVMDPGTRLADLVTHLIEKHGHRRLAFFTGPADNQVAVDRFLAFERVLTQHGLPLPPENVLPGDLTFYTARSVLEARFTTNRPAFDALVCANDETAIEAIKFFQEKGLRIPQDLAVTGLDDIDHASLLLPQLTTVREPVADMGARAVQVALDLLKNPGQPPTVHKIPTFLKIRSSCGCLAKLEPLPGLAPVNLPLRFHPSILDPGKEQEEFLLEFQRFIEDRIRAGDDAGRLQGQIFSFRTRVLRELADIITPRNITDLLSEMQKIVTQLSQLVYAQYQGGFEGLAHGMRAFVRMEQLVEWADIEPELTHWLPKLDIGFFALVLYPEPVVCATEADWKFPPLARVDYAWFADRAAELTEEERLFDPATAVLPAGVLETIAGPQRVFNLLSYVDRQFGYYLYDTANLSSMAAELFRINIKVLLQNHILHRTSHA